MLEAASSMLLGDIPYEQHAELFIVGEFIAPGKKFNTTTVMLEDHEPAAVMAIAKGRLRLLIRYDSILWRLLCLRFGSLAGSSVTVREVR
ncbi:hypothetical protein D3C75_987020 [compost metagenome]